MKRPLAYVGFTGFFALSAAIYLFREATVCFFAAALALLCCVFLCFRQENTGAVVLLTAAVFFLAGSLFAPQLARSQELGETELTVCATVCQPPETVRGRDVYILEVESARDSDGRTVTLSGKVRVTAPHSVGAERYDQINGTVGLFPISDTIAPYYAARGIFYSGYLDQYAPLTVETPSTLPWYHVFDQLREHLEGVLHGTMSEESADFLSGVLLGDRRMISQETEELFQLFGVSHILSVSGLHFSILMRALLTLLLFLRIPKRLASVLAMPVILLFMALTGFSFSVIRSGVMLLLYLLATAIDRKDDSLNSLGFAMLILSVTNPFSPGDVGLILSFTSTLGILLFQNPLCRRLDKWLETYVHGKILTAPLWALGHSLCMTVSASVLSLPVSMTAFGTLSLLTPLSNLVLVFPATILLVAGSIALLLGSIWLPAGWIPGIVCEVLTRFELSAAELLSKIPFGVVRTDFAFVYLWLAAAAALIGGCLLSAHRKRLLPKAGICLALMLAVLIAAQNLFAGNRILVESFYSDGELHVVASRNGEGAVLWGGTPGTYTLARYGISHLEESEGDGLLHGDVVLEGCTETACLVSVFGTRMLICGEDCEIGELPPQWLDAELVWVSEIPGQYPLLSAQACVSLSEDTRNLPFPSVFYSEQFGRFQAICEPDGTVRTGRIF